MRRHTTTTASSRCAMRSRRAEIADVIAAIDPLEAQTEAFLRTRDNGTFGIARAGEITFRPHLVAQSAALRAFSRHPLLLGPVPRPDRPRRASVLGSVRVQKAGGRQGLSVAPGQRLHVHRAAALSDVLDRAHRRDASTTAVRGWFPACIGSARCTPLDAARLPVSGGRRGAVAVEVRGGFDRGVLEPDAAPHRPQRDHVRCASLISCSTPPDGAVAYPQGNRAPCDAADRQYLVLHEGSPV